MAEQVRNWNYQAHPRDNHGFEEDTRHDHDVDTLILQSHRLYKAAKQMKIQRSKISKREKKKNEKLAKSKGKYSAELQDLKEALEQVNKIVAGTRQDEQFDLPHLPRRQGQKRGATSLPRLGKDKTRQPMLDTFQNRCEQCGEKERLINEQLLEMDRTEALNHKKVQELYEQVDSLSREINKEKVLKEDVLRRLSEIASSKLRDNNPNIADLSDTNRPTKLGEKLSELYDNAWTDAIEAMQRPNENEAIQELLTMLMEVYRRCMGLATDGFFERIQRSILYPQDGECGKERLPDQMKQQIKEFRKYEAPNVKEAVAKVVLANLPIGDRNEPKIEKYLKDCVEICWLAAVQDPPLFLSASHKVEFDKNVYKEYTQSGQYVDFIVWPALYLHKDGPLLSKGVAQGSNTHPRGAVTQTSHATRLVPNVSAHIVHRSVSPNTRSDVASRGQTDRRDEANWRNEQGRGYKQDRMNETVWMHETDGRQAYMLNMHRSVSPNTRSDVASRGQTDRRDEANWRNEQGRGYKQDRMNETDWMHETDGRQTYMYTGPQKSGDDYIHNKQVQRNYQTGENMRVPGIQTTYQLRGNRNDTGFNQTIYTGQNTNQRHTDL